MTIEELSFKLQDMINKKAEGIKVHPSQFSKGKLSGYKEIMDLIK